MARLFDRHNALRLVSVLLLVFSAIRSHSTVAVVIFTGSGIAIAMDSKGVVSMAGSGGYLGEKQIQKMFVIQDRIVIGSIGKEVVTGKSKSFHYDFATWVLYIKSGLREDISFNDFVGTVKIEIRNLMPFWQQALDGGMLHQQDALDMFEPLVQYVITGYQNGKPRVCVLELYVDWEHNRILGPYYVALDELMPAATKVGAYTLGIKAVIADFDYPKSYAYEQAMARCRKAFKDYLSGVVSLDESATLSRVLVSIEEETNPSHVGGDIQVIEINPSGRAREFNEMTLRKGGARTQKNTPK